MHPNEAIARRAGRSRGRPQRSCRRPAAPTFSARSSRPKKSTDELAVDRRTRCRASPSRVVAREREVRVDEVAFAGNDDADRQLATTTACATSVSPVIDVVAMPLVAERVVERAVGIEAQHREVREVVLHVLHAPCCRRARARPSPCNARPRADVALPRCTSLPPPTKRRIEHHRWRCSARRLVRRDGSLPNRIAADDERAVRLHDDIACEIRARPSCP